MPVRYSISELMRVFFSIQLALEGHTVIAVDFQKNLQLIFEYAARRAGVNNVGTHDGGDHT